MKKDWKKLVVVCLAAGLVWANISSVGAVESEASRRLAILSAKGDEAFVTRGSREMKASAGIPLGEGNQLRTGKASSLYLEADDDKLIKLSSMSQADITKASAKSLKVTLKSGELFFNVDKPLAEDEELQFEAAQTSMSVRGTSGILKFNDERIELYLIEGTVEWDVGSESVTITPGQSAAVVLRTGDRWTVSNLQGGYTFEGVTDFTFEDLDSSSLRAILEQRDKLDLDAIGLSGETAEDMISDRMKELHQEEVQRQQEASDDGDEWYEPIEEEIPDSNTEETENESSGTTENGTSESGTSESGTSDSGTSDSGTSESETSDSGTSDSGTSDSGTSA